MRAIGPLLGFFLLNFHQNRTPLFVARYGYTFGQESSLNL